jgi:hypothetical protein
MFDRVPFQLTDESIESPASSELAADERERAEAQVYATRRDLARRLKDARNADRKEMMETGWKQQMQGARVARMYSSVGEESVGRESAARAAPSLVPRRRSTFDRRRRRRLAFLLSSFPPQARTGTRATTSGARRSCR